MGSVVFEDCDALMELALIIGNCVKNFVEFVIHIIEMVFDVGNIFFENRNVTTNFDDILLELLNLDFKNIGFGDFFLDC